MAKAMVRKSKKLSELERNAVELLVQLSGSSSAYSSSDLYDTRSDGTEESDGKSSAPPDRRFDDHQALSSSSKYELLLVEDGDEYDEGILGARKKRKFRSISELHELTEPLSLLVANKRKRKTSGN